ncbi:MAG: lipid-binding SYLF domain-containing protein [Nitrospirota bacterium]
MRVLARWMAAWRSTVRVLAVGAALVWIVASPGVSLAADAKEIDADVDLTLKEFAEKITGSEDFLKHAKGVLVFPSIYKAGFIFGAEYGTGALRVAGKTVDYYNLAGASFGFQIGAQKTSVILMFMKDVALEKFRSSTGFELGVDAGATIVTVGAEGSLDTTKLAEPILAFVFSQRGLMGGVTLSGSKFTKLDMK